MEKAGQKPTDIEQLNMFDDKERYKLHRKNAPSTSKDAAYSVPLAKTRAFVLGLIEEAGEKGITVKEMEKNYPNMGRSTISCRPSELERLNFIFYKGDKRDNSRIIRHIKYKKSLHWGYTNKEKSGQERISDPSRKGDFAEYYAVTWLWDNGYEVFKNLGSTGMIDLIAIKDGEITLIDVKTDKVNKPHKEHSLLDPRTRKCRFVNHYKGSDNENS
jgi:Holliday junction resolvase-like predicted endonuclease